MSDAPPDQKVVFLFDVDNTLLDNDRVIVDLRRYLTKEVGAGRADLYFKIFEDLRAELGYSDYLGALQRYRVRQQFLAGLAAALHPPGSAENVHALRGEAEVAHDRDAGLSQSPDLRQHPAAALELDGLRTAFFQVPHGAGQRRLRT